MMKMFNDLKCFFLFVVILLVTSGCRKNASAQQPEKTEEVLISTPAPSTTHDLQWILDKYKYDNMHVMVAAHRGNWNNEPENSLSGIRQCIENGVEILELDVRLTSDEQLVLMHDKTLGRTATGSGEIKYHPLAYLKQQYLIDKNGNVTNQRIPTLEEALLQAKGKALIMLDKSEYLLPWIEKVLEKTGTTQQVIFLEFNNYKKTLDIYESLLNKAIYIPGIHHSNENIEGYINDFEKSPYKPSCYAFWIKKENSTVLPYISVVEQQGDRIWINTVDTDQCAGHTDSVSLDNPEKGWGWAIDKGASIILTDEAEKLITYLKSINRRN